MSPTLLILKNYTTFKDVQMISKHFFDISTGFRFSKMQWGSVPSIPVAVLGQWCYVAQINGGHLYFFWFIFIFRPCWNVDISYNWIYKGPCITSVFVNLFFLGWIVYVLVSKFHTDISDHAAMKKTAKAIGKAKVSD